MSDGGFPRFFWRVTACHVLTYFVAGLLALYLLDYKTFFATGPMAELMKPVNAPIVAVGPALQVIRGLVFALVLWPFREHFLDRPRGWLLLWGLLVGLCIVSTAGPAPGSIEGIIYTKIPIGQHLHGLPEVLFQTLAFSWLLVMWYRRPSRAWNIGMGILVGLIVLMSLAGALMPRPA